MPWIAAEQQQANQQRCAYAGGAGHMTYRTGKPSCRAVRKKCGQQPGSSISLTDFEVCSKIAGTQWAGSSSTVIEYCKRCLLLLLLPQVPLAALGLVWLAATSPHARASSTATTGTKTRCVAPGGGGGRGGNPLVPAAHCTWWCSRLKLQFCKTAVSHAC